MASTDPTILRVTQDIVAILETEGLQPLFADAHPMNATVRETSKIMTSAVEDGSLRADHIVYDPVEIDLPLLLTDDIRSLYQNLRNAWKNQTLLTVQTKLSTYPNQMIYEMPHEENQPQGDSTVIQVKMREVQTVKAEYGSLPPRKVAGANSNQANTVKKGNQQTSEATPAAKKKTSVLYSVFNK